MQADLHVFSGSEGAPGATEFFTEEVLRQSAAHLTPGFQTSELCWKGPHRAGAHLTQDVRSE